jgi:hypothetical protein
MKPVALMPTITLDEAMLGERRLLKDPEINLASFFAGITEGLLGLKLALASSDG